MACGACASRAQARGGAPARTLYQVVLDGGAGRTAFQTHDLTLARKISGNYPGSMLVPDPDAPAETAERTDRDEPDDVTEPVTSS